MQTNGLGFVVVVLPAVFVTSGIIGGERLASVLLTLARIVYAHVL